MRRFLRLPDICILNRTAERAFRLATVCIVLPCLLAGCADTAPRVAAVRSTVIFDYGTPGGLPQMRLAVFVQPLSDAARVKTIEVTHEASRLVWQIDDVRFAGIGSSVWTGSADLVPAYGELIPTGPYDLHYIDAAERVTQSRFTVRYPAQLMQTATAAVRDVLGPATKESVTLYAERDGTGTVLYYGPEKNEWRDTARLLSEYPGAASLRKSLESADRTVLCILPPETIKEIP
ncbi:hypothetical protein [Treponema brennaborense]|uniref:Uncharacterized protein n=1 Tax=Treponema brennaborense (strain DSM 12168 / CIP 105900 / DD5/3) TaxID=906968 RepID=F4LLH3_TREBD|nr:hypothetical protein [Treponema brennaborense]AEE16637.1 hypothetical protein Trebr_1209 [Treponema brennaborense DSM 12168]